MHSLQKIKCSSLSSNLYVHLWLATQHGTDDSWIAKGFELSFEVSSAIPLVMQPSADLYYAVVVASSELADQARPIDVRSG